MSCFSETKYFFHVHLVKLSQILPFSVYLDYSYHMLKLFWNVCYTGLQFSVFTHVGTVIFLVMFNLLFLLNQSLIARKVAYQLLNLYYAPGMKQVTNLVVHMLWSWSQPHLYLLQTLVNFFYAERVLLHIFSHNTSDYQ